jgi:hypothetical protein
MRARSLAALLAGLADPPPLGPVIVSVNVPEYFRAHLDAVLEQLGTWDETITDDAVVLADCRDGFTAVSVLPRLRMVKNLRRRGWDELAEDLAAPCPGGRSRIVLFNAAGDVRIYGFRWGALAPGGDA